MAKTKIPPAEELYSLQEIVTTLKISERTIWRMIEDGELTEGKHWFDFRRRNAVRRRPRFWLPKLQEYFGQPVAFR